MSLKQRYRETIQPKLLKDLGLSNVHEVPKVVKVTVNRGLGEAAQNAKALEASIAELATITGQKVVVTRAKKAIAGFKIRQGMPIGVAVTLRGERMYAFLERLINLADLEAGDGFLGAGDDHLLTGDRRKLGDRGFEGLGVLGRLSETPVDGDLDHLGDFVNVGETEILQQLGLNRLPVALFE